jgi:hypothetical protein
MASRMVFEQEDKIRIINSFGLDSLLLLNIDEKGNIKDNKLPIVIIKSVCKIDHYNGAPGVDKHMMMDQKFISFDRTLERLVRMNQRFKVKQYHLKSTLRQK